MLDEEIEPHLNLRIKILIILSFSYFTGLFIYYNAPKEPGLTIYPLNWLFSLIISLIIFFLPWLIWLYWNMHLKKSRHDIQERNVNLENVFTLGIIFYIFLLIFVARIPISKKYRFCQNNVEKLNSLIPTEAGHRYKLELLPGTVKKSKIQTCCPSNFENYLIVKNGNSMRYECNYHNFDSPPGMHKVGVPIITYRRKDWIYPILSVFEMLKEKILHRNNNESKESQVLRIGSQKYSNLLFYFGIGILEIIVSFLLLSFLLWRNKRGINVFPCVIFLIAYFIFLRIRDFIYEPSSSSRLLDAGLYYKLFSIFMLICISVIFILIIRNLLSNKHIMTSNSRGQ